MNMKNRFSIQHSLKSGVLFTLIYLLSPVQLFAQQKEQGAQNPVIKVIARASEKNKLIHIRWGVSDAQTWKISNDYGFTVERFTILRDKKMLATPERKLIAASMKPGPLAQWEKLAKEDNYAAVIAQALYGDNFEVSGVSAGMSGVIAQSQDLEQRFGFSLYAADMSFNAAKMAGWGYTDRDVQANEKYFYRIKSAAPLTILKIDSAGAYIGLADDEPLPKVEEISAKFGDKSVVLSWDYDRLSNYYNAYFIEKSTDNGVTFKKLGDLPLTNVNEKEGSAAKRMYYIDSLVNNQDRYQYRIYGINPLGNQVLILM